MQKVLKGFYGGFTYPAVFTALVFIGHIFPPIDIPVLLFLTALSLFGLFYMNDARLLLPPVFQLYFTVNPTHTPGVPTFSDYYITPFPAVSILLIFASFAVSLLIFSVRNRKTRRRLPEKRLLYSLVLFCAALLLNGLYQNENSVKNLLFGVSLSLSFLVFYLFFLSFFSCNKKNIGYLMKILVLTGVLITLELCNLYRTSVIFDGGSVVKHSIFIGWGTWASAGSMLSMLIPPAFFLAAKEKNGAVWFLLGVFIYIGAFLSMARAAFLIATMIFLLSLPLAFSQKERRERSLRLTLGLVIVAALLLFFFREPLFTLVKDTLSLGFSDNGRFEIWKTGIERFLSSPIFGTGFYNSYENDWTFHALPYFYHNTWIQMLAASGIFGFFLYMLHRIETLKAVFSKPSLTRITLFLSILSLLLHSLIDVHFFVVYTGLFYSTLLAVIALDKSQNM